SLLTCEMRLGNGSTTVTGTVTPASVNTRVMPHLRPTRPMVIFNPHTARAAIGPRVGCNRSAVWVRVTPGPSMSPREGRHLRITGVGTHALRPLKWTAEYT